MRILSAGNDAAGQKPGSAGHQIRNGIEALYQRYHVDLVLGGHIHEYERSLPVGNNGTLVETHHSSNATYGHYINPALPVYMTIGMAGYPHFIGGAGEWPRNVTWSATHIIKWGYTRMHFLSSTDFKMEFVSNGIAWKADGNGDGIPVPGNAKATVEDSLWITKSGQG